MVREGAATSSTWERRIQTEWRLLQEMAQLNPDRISDFSARDATFYISLRHTPSPVLGAFDGAHTPRFDRVTEHRIRVEYPAFFPSLPMEVYLKTPVAHPNIHPESGFICLWQKHLVSNSIEHVLHKTAAMLGWALKSDDATHVMQPKAFAYARLHGSEVEMTLHADPLVSVQHLPDVRLEDSLRNVSPSRRRLSVLSSRSNTDSHLVEAR
jgi:ubiquitin-protein ligase